MLYACNSQIFIVRQVFIIIGILSYVDYDNIDSAITFPRDILGTFGICILSCRIPVQRPGKRLRSIQLCPNELFLPYFFRHRVAEPLDPTRYLPEARQLDRWRLRSSTAV